MPSLEAATPTRKSRRPQKPKPGAGVTREDSDDELGLEDHPWEWIYEDKRAESPDPESTTRKRKRSQEEKIIGARMGKFECRLGDCVLLKAEGSNEAWVGLICEFVEDEEEEKAANFMWFSTEKEIRNKEKKRTDFYWVRAFYRI